MRANHGTAEFLQDNGKFGEHESLVMTYLQRCESKAKSDLELALKMERGVAFSRQDS